MVERCEKVQLINLKKKSNDIKLSKRLPSDLEIKKRNKNDVHTVGTLTWCLQRHRSRGGVV